MKWILAATLGLAALCGSAAAQTRGDSQAAAFRNLCEPAMPSMAAFASRALGFGWRPADSGADPSYERMIEMTQDGLAELPELQIQGLVLSRVEGDLYAIATRGRLPDDQLIGCGVYDFAATQDAGVEAIGGWLGAGPQTQDVDGGRAHVWTAPQRLPGVSSISIVFVAPEGAMARQAGFHGQGMVLERLAPPASGAAE